MSTWVERIDKLREQTATAGNVDVWLVGHIATWDPEAAGKVLDLLAAVFAGHDACIDCPDLDAAPPEIDPYPVEPCPVCGEQGASEGQADSHRYKQLGNSVAVPVFEWVGHRLIAVDEAVS